jgi:hypothetical protein
MRRHTRRSLKTATAAASAILTSRAASQSRPNILFIVCDDLNAAVEGMGGHPQAHTPNIRRLMDRGVRRGGTLQPRQRIRMSGPTLRAMPGTGRQSLS